ncbi:MAG: hypothetical protein RL030_1774 [Pseudomonadota bacterium]|jgi:hypothetical protein
MPSATITLTDEDGAVAVHATLAEPLDNDSRAHQTAQMLLASLNSVFETLAPKLPVGSCVSKIVVRMRDETAAPIPVGEATELPALNG